jgi:hypothetical protein
MPGQLRHLFGVFLTCQTCNDPAALWDKHKEAMMEDFKLAASALPGAQNPLPAAVLAECEFKALRHLDECLRAQGHRLSDYPMLPQPPPVAVPPAVVAEQVRYDPTRMQQRVDDIVPKLNQDQRRVFDQVRNIPIAHFPWAIYNDAFF